MDEKQNLKLNAIKIRLEEAQKKQSAGDFIQAIQCYKDVIVEYPERADAVHYLGLAYYQNQEYSLAVPLLERAIELDPDAIHFRRNNAIIYRDMELINLAVRDLQYCVSAYPNDIKFKETLFELYQEQAANDRAISLAGIQHFFQGNAYQQTINDYAVSLARIKNFLKKISSQQALQMYHELLRIKEDAATVCFDLGVHYYSQGDNVKATFYYRRAIEYKPTYASAHWNLGFCLLLLGDFKAGWPEYEWRFFNNSYLNGREYILLLDDRYQHWQGEPLKNKTLLVIGEQGRGDVIQFIRFLRDIKRQEKDCRIILLTREELIPLFKSMFIIDEFCLRRHDVPVSDYYIPLMSLPFILKITEKKLLADNKPYLFSTTQLTLPKKKRKLSIGIAYKGNKEFRKNNVRSIPWQQFSLLLNNTDIQFYSFQKDDDEIAAFSADNLVDLTTQMRDFDHSAAWVMEMDLIICTDTALAHLAGALGKPVWILLSTFPDWRWMCGRTDSPWYPSARLYRQTSTGDWQAVIKKVRSDLDEWVRNLESS